VAAPGSHYRFFDLNLNSELELPELSHGTASAAAASAAACTVSIALASGPLAPEFRLQWQHAADRPGEPGGPLSAPVGAATLLRFSGLADFLVDPERLRVHCLPVPALPRPTLRHLLLDQVLPRLVGQTGRLVLHASAVALPAGAMVFVGRSGWGKSTLAAGFEPPARPFVDDSVLLIPGDSGGVRAVASYPGSRLWPDAVEALFPEHAGGQAFACYSSKRRVDFPAGQAALPASLPLRALFLLNDPVAAPAADIVIEPVAGAATLMELLRRCFLLDPGDPVVARRLWQTSGDLLRTGVPVAKLAYPRSHPDRARLCERLLEHVKCRVDPIDTGMVTD
jgi:hypothetical protein